MMVTPHDIMNHSIETIMNTEHISKNLQPALKTTFLWRFKKKIIYHGHLFITHNKITKSKTDIISKIIHFLK